MASRAGSASVFVCDPIHRVRFPCSVFMFLLALDAAPLSEGSSRSVSRTAAPLMDWWDTNMLRTGTLGYWWRAYDSLMTAQHIFCTDSLACQDTSGCGSTQQGPCSGSPSWAGHQGADYVSLQSDWVDVFHSVRTTGSSVTIGSLLPAFLSDPTPGPWSLQPRLSLSLSLQSQVTRLLA